MKTHPSTSHIAFVGNFSPRRCGIATFTTDISEAVASEFPASSCIAAIIRDSTTNHDYSSRVRFEIDQEDPESYLRAADFLRVSNVEVVSLQHEFGIYGGPAGSHILGFLERVRKPVVTTLHTVLKKPDAEQRFVMDELNRLSERFVVMAEHGKHLLTQVYGVDPEKIDFIPHGVIDMPFVDSDFYKDIFDAEGKTVLLTFGLLSPNKGIETAIEALPAILAQHPDVIYLIVGATHPHLLAKQGELYRDSLIALVDQLGISQQVIFINRFVALEELKEFIGGSDIYLTPYRNEEQVTSGTLAYAFGAGKACISTPYWHARELLAEERGIIVPFSDAPAIASAVNELLTHPTRMTALRKRAWKEGRKMTWPEVARRYMASFERARDSISIHPHISDECGKASHAPLPIPPVKLDHLYRMTDHTGIFQHAIYNVPNYLEAYCTDDNARALIFTVFHQLEHGPDPELDRAASSYLAFLWYAFDPEIGRFRNFMSHDRVWLENMGSEDSHARALWAVGTTLGNSINEGSRNLSALLFQRGLKQVKHFRSPRAWAFTLIAIHEYLRAFSGDRVVEQMRTLLVDRLISLYRAHSYEDWKWFELTATYDNGKLSHALITSENPAAIEIGLISLKWLMDQQTHPNGHFSPIGCHGFWHRGQPKARFDQQPVEAHAMISACMAAAEVTGDPSWSIYAHQCFGWFLGHNDLGRCLYNEATGGCRDALLRDDINQNEGAESTLAYLLSRSELTRRPLSIHP